MTSYHREAMISRLVSLMIFGSLFIGVAPTACAGEAKKDSLTLPRLVDLGAGKCIPCKKMAPILDEMKEDYVGIVDIQFLDVWKDPKVGKPYRIRVIPTQIFFDKTGKEVFRHEGFFSREDMEKVFREKMGVTPVPRREKKEKEKEVGLLPWEFLLDEDPSPALGDRLLLGQAPDQPPINLEIVYTTVACACVMERCARLRQALQELLDSYGATVTRRWVDRAEQTEEADSLLQAWTLEELPALALVDAAGRPY